MIKHKINNNPIIKKGFTEFCLLGKTFPVKLKPINKKLEINAMNANAQDTSFFLNGFSFISLINILYYEHCEKHPN